MTKELIVVNGKVIEQNRSFSPTVGENIGYEKGAVMVKRWYDANPNDVLSHFVGRDIIEQILAQPGCVGIRIFGALNELGIRQPVMVGVDANGKNILNYNVVNADGSIVMQNAIVADKVLGDDAPSSDSSSSWF